MVTVFIKTDSHYTVNRDRIRKTIETFLADKNIKTDVEVSVTVVGDRMMKTLNNSYRKIDETTDVLSFPLMPSESTGVFIEPPDDVLRLGDIVISYPQAVNDAAQENKFVDDKIDELVVHSMLHLIGQHHD